MTKKCKSCGAEQIEYPISKLPLKIECFDEKGKKVMKFNWQALKWNNLNKWNFFVGDWTKIAWLITVLLLAWSYSHDIGVVHKIYANPCDFVLKNYQACHNADLKNTQFNLTRDLTLIPVEKRCYNN
jgi:hypothetical protein